jgi:hypothetical protein
MPHMLAACAFGVYATVQYSTLGCTPAQIIFSKDSMADLTKELHIWCKAAI